MKLGWGTGLSSRTVACVTIPGKQCRLLYVSSAKALPLRGATTLRGFFVVHSIQGNFLFFHLLAPFDHFRMGLYLYHRHRHRHTLTSRSQKLFAMMDTPS